MYKRPNQDGFTLIELVVTVSLLMIFSALGIAKMTGVNEEQEINAVALAAQTVMNDALSYEADYDDRTTYEMAVEEWDSEYVSVTVDGTNECFTITAHLSEKPEVSSSVESRGCVPELVIVESEEKVVEVL